MSDIKQELECAGGSFVKSDEWSQRHLTPINPSKDFSYVDLKRLGVMFGRAFQTIESYFNERSVGYYSPSVSYDQFVALSSRKDAKDLPFSFEMRRMLEYRETLRRYIASKGAISI